ncbi:MAG: DUF1275 domain-containing protein [Halobacteriovoraceae bacterium]|nr:DUF1275 domain-containing protein [Halobacteriovoraceae bacterium]
MTDIILRPENRITWSLLAFQGGFVNVGGLLTVHIFVSHITGFSAHFSIHTMNGDFANSIYFLLVPVFFLGGAFLSSIFTEVRKQKNRPPVYIHILVIQSILFLVVSILGKFGFFGNFGEEFHNFRDFILLSILAFSCGAQNAIFTHYSKSIIRTTHLTGITTDLGIGLAKSIISKEHSEDYFNKIRINLIISFILGSLFGVAIFPKFQFLSFLFPSFFSILVGLKLYKSRKNAIVK